MWSFFSRDPAKDFPYEIGEKVSGLEDKSIWSLHQGKKKSSGDPVSIFAFDVKSASDSQVQVAKNSLKRIKTLRHPNILTFLDGVETDKVIYFATEPVIPLETYLKDNDNEGHNEVAISWGLHQIVKGFSFLVNDCSLIHNNICMVSVFVDPAGEWKLAGVDYMYPAQGPDSIAPMKILPLLEKYDPPEKSEGKKIRGEKWSSDMWGLGCLIWEVFNGTLPRTSSLKSPGKIPQSLIPNYCELVGANPRSRPNPAHFIENCRKRGGFMNNTFVNSMMFLEEIQIKDQIEKNKFFASLTPSLDTFPSLFCKKKILPQLLNAFEYGNAGSSVLAPMFKIGKLLDTEEYQKKIVPCVVKLFSSPDRATRVKLLQQIEFFIEHLKSNTVNDQIFPNVNSGFMDTNPMVRESTIKAMLHLAPKLNYKNLNEELMKQFARLQAKDDQGGIRTNTTICLGKIAGYINPAIRQKILCSAFMRSLKDPFPPARQAGILGIASTQNFYSLTEVAMRLLPPLCAATRDPDKAVRDQAFKTINGFISKLQKVSEHPELEEEYEKDVNSGSAGQMSTAGWAGWAVTGMSSITSKIYNKATTKNPAGGTQAPTQGSSPAKPSTSEGLSSSEPASSSKTSSRMSNTDKWGDDDEEEEGVDTAGGGWDDDNWGDMDSSSKSAFDPSTKDDIGDDNQGNNNRWDEDDDEDWGSIEQTSAPKVDPKTLTKPRAGEFVSTKHSGLKTTDAINWSGETQDDFFSSLGNGDRPRSKSNTPVRESPPRNSPSRDGPRAKSSSLSPAVSDKMDSGWGDGGGWGDDTDAWGDMNDETTSGESEAERLKREKAEKRQQRQRELQEKRDARKAGSGAMKLGTKKVVDLS